MLLASWLAPLVQTIGNAFTQKTKRRASRKSLTTQRWLANSWIERLEDRTVLSTSVTISPVFAGTIFDQNLDGTGDNSGLTYYSGGQPTVGNGGLAPFDAYNARAVSEFNISSLAGATIESATITASSGYIFSGGPTVDWYFYTGDGSRLVSDYEISASLVESVPSTGSAYALSLDVAAELQALIIGGAFFAGFRGQRPSGLARIGWNAPFNLNVTYATVASFPALTAINPLGSLAYEGTFNNALSTVGATDTLTINLEAGQRVTLVADPASTFRPVIELYDPVDLVVPIATQTAVGAGDEAVILSVPVSTSGTYTVRVKGASSTTGSYSLRLILDAAVESESYDGADNGTILAAQDLTSAFITVGSGAVATVLGTTDFGPLASEFEPNDTTATANPASGNFAAFVGDRFQLRISGTVSSVADADYFNIGTLQSGDVITLTNSGSDSSRGTLSDAILELYRSNGGSPVLVTKDDDSGPGEDSLIDHFTVTDLDTYFVLATNFSTETGTYQLGIFLENSGAAPSTVGSLITETEGNNSFATANNASTSWRAVNLLAQTAGSITASDVDVYQYLFNAGDLVTVDIDSTSSLDARVSLLNAGGVVLAVEDGTSNRLGLGDLDSSLYAFRIPSSGTYFVQVEANSGTGSYAADVYLSGLTAPAVSVLDLYAFSLTAGQSVSLVVEGLTAGNVDLALLDSAGVTVATGSVGASNVDESISNFVSVTGGTYYAQVTGGNRVDYSLVVVRDAGFDLEANNSFATAQVLNSNVLGHVVGQDWYQFSAGIGDTITLATATPGDGANEFVNNLNPFIELFDPNVVSLASDDDSGPSSNSLLTFIATSTGMHRVRLTGFGGSTGEYFLSASITNNPSPTVSIAANDATAAEPSDGGQFTISLTNPSSTATTVFFTVTGSASATDYTSLGTSVVIPAFATSVTLNMALLADTLVEGDETVIVTLTSVSGDSQIFLDSDAADRTAMVTISDTEDTATVSIMANDATATEPSDNGQFTISLTNPSNTPTTVFFTVTGTASGTDYTSLGTSVVIPANATSVTLDVTLLADILVEGDETVIVTLDSVSGDPQISLDLTPANLTATVTIFDNDFDVTVAVAPGSVAEDGGTNLVYTFTRTGSSTTNPLTVQFSVGGVAVFGTDYSQSGAASFGVSSGSVVILAGLSTATVTIDPTSDLRVETAESVVLTVSANSAYQVGSPSVAIGTITDIDSAVFSITSASAVEGAGVTFTITLSAAVEVDTSVTVTTFDGTAMLADNDYTEAAGRIVTFSAGVISQTITIDTTDDNNVEGDETFTAMLVGLNDGGLLVTIDSMNDEATGTILNDDASLSVAATSANKAEGHSGNTSFTFTVTRLGDTSGTASVSYAVTGSGVNLANSADFGGTLPSGTVNFNANDVTQTITIDVSGDSAFESDEGFTVTLSSPSVGAIVGTATAVGTIVNDDGSLSVAASSANKAEGQSGNTSFEFTVTRLGDTSGAASVSYAVTGSGVNPANGADFGGTLPSGTVNFNANDVTQTITIDVRGDTTVENNEGFTVTLSSPSTGSILGTSTATGTIVNDDGSLSIAPSSANKAEGHSANTLFTFTVTRTGDTSGTASVSYAVTGNGVNPADGGDFGGTLPFGTVNFNANDVTQTITIDVRGDTTVENDEGFTVTLSNPSIGSILGTSTATGTIVNDDASLSLAASSANNPEGHSGNTSFTFTVTRTGDTSGTASVSYAVTGNGVNPADAADFGGALPFGTVNFNANDVTQTITIDVRGDSDFENDEDFVVTLSSPSAGAILGTTTADGLILNDDASLSVAATSANNAEGLSGNTSFTFTVTRTGDTSGTASVSYAVTGSGVNPADAADFGGALPFGTVNFNANDVTQTITVDVSGDTVVESFEGFTVTLSSPSMGSVLGTSTADGLILNDDSSSVSVAASSANKVEGHSSNTSFMFTVTRLGDTSGVASVSYAVTGSGVNPANGADFGGTLPSGTVNFNANDVTQTITIDVRGDTAVESDEGFTVTLSSPSAGTDLGISTTTGTILNDDASLSVAATSANNAEGHSGNTSFTFTVTRTGDTSGAASVSYAVTGSGVNASDAADFGGTLPSGMVNFAATDVTRTITIDVSGDTTVESDEGFTVMLSSPSTGSVLGTSTATGIITNDDSAVFSIANVSAFEGVGLAFTVTLSNPVDVATSVTVSTTDGTATVADSDYSAVVASRVSFVAGVTMQTVTVNTISDLKVEVDETLTATLGNLSNGSRNVSLSGTNSAATGTIFNNNTEVSVSVSPGSVLEDGLIPLVYTFTRIGVVAGTLTTNFTVGGSADLSDYSPSGAATFTATTRTVVFASGNSTATVTITPTVDSNTEVDETVVLSVAFGTGYAIGTTNSSTGTIRDDDAQISLSVSPSNVTEDGATNLAYTFNRVGSTSGAQVVNFNVGGTAMFGSDYSTANATSFTATTGSITFAPGASSVTMFVDPAADNAIESDESVSITLATGSGYLTPSLVPVIGTIDNDDFDVSMALTPDSLAEDAPGTFAYTFSRTGGLNRPLSVQVGIGGTALAGFDYSQTGAAPFSASGGIVTFASGASTATLRIDPIVDTGIEADETVEVTLLPGSGYTATGTAFYRGTITNDDQLVSLSSATASVTEDGAENLVVIFTRTGATAGALSIPMTLGGTATFNTDYVATGNATFSAGASQLLFAAGVTTATLTFDPAIEAELESSEVLLLTLAKNALLGVPATIVAAGTILNDDATVSVSVTPDRVPEEGAGNLVYTFQRFGDTSQAATVNFSVSGLATFGVDYLQTGAASFTSTSGTIVIPAGRSDATLTLDPTPDGLNEANETAILTILPSLGFTPSGDPALGTIINQVTNIALSVTPTQLPENSTSNLLYKFTRTGNLIGELTVQFAVSGSATFAADYLQSGASSFSATEGSITFADGATTATLTIDPQSDSIDELTETVVVTILPDTELYNITGAGTATTSITDTSMISLAVSPSSVNENGVPNLLFNFSRSGSTQQALTVNFSVAGSASFGTDYSQTGAATFSASVGTVTFAAGSSTKTVTVNPTADFTIEADETVILTVVSGTSYLIAGDYTATGIIANDDVNIGNVITLDSLGRLHITDTVGRDDRLKVTKNAANELVITDSANPLTTTVGRQVTAQEVRVPLASITSKVLIVELNGGADHIDLSGIPTRTVSGVVVNLLDVTVSGGAGDDTIIGSAGSDTLLGGDGNDSIDGGSGNDGISGDAGNDKLNGNSGNDSIMGGTGNDYMLGGAGNDRMVGQSGEDTVIGQGGIDRIAGGSGFGRDVGDVVTDNFAEIDEAFRISFNGTKFLLI